MIQYPDFQIPPLNLWSMWPTNAMLVVYYDFYYDEWSD